MVICKIRYSAEAGENILQVQIFLRLFFREHAAAHVSKGGMYLIQFGSGKYTAKDKDVWIEVYWFLLQARLTLFIDN